MSERRAFILAFAGLAIPFSAVTVVILETSGSGVLAGLALGVFAALGGWIAGCIVVHYGKLEKRREREEILLRR